VSALDLAAAAEALVGVRFRLHGRDPASGLDCIGVFAAAMAGIGRPVAVPNGYALRLADLAAFRPLAAGFGLEELGGMEAAGDARPGDVLIFAVGPAQFHLAIAAVEHGFVHAHAGLRRVVLGPAGGDWRTAGHWRLIEQD
jgi:cell wall-associated NlpC family hydrolase